MLSSVFAGECLVCGGGGGGGGGMVYIYRGINYDDMTCWQSSVSQTAITSSQHLIAGNLPQNIPAEPRPGPVLVADWSSTISILRIYVTMWLCGSSDQIYIQRWRINSGHTAEQRRASIKYHYQVKVVGWVGLHRRAQRSSDRTVDRETFIDIYSFTGRTTGASSN